MSELTTAVHALNVNAWHSLCGVVAGLWPRLEWRHSGLGVLQAYVHEGAEHELRVHVWHPSLRRAGIAESGLFHDHRFDMMSTVLVGEIRQHELELYEGGRGDWCTYEVLHARAAAQASDGATFHQDPSLLPERYEVSEHAVRVGEGNWYLWPKRRFHGTHFDNRLAVTLVEKTNQDARPARILAPVGVPLVNAFEEPLPREAWTEPLAAAHDALIARWRGEDGCP